MAKAVPKTTCCSMNASAAQRLVLLFDPVIATTTRDYLIAMQYEFAVAFAAAQNAGALANSADPYRLARRFQANLTALRLALHQGMEASNFAQLAEDMATEIENLRVKGTA